MAMDYPFILPHLRTSSSSSASKLPIKRKTPDSDPPLLDPDDLFRPAPSPPFKFHRIWTEPDEICFLLGLLDCSTSSQNLSFPRDLGIFYAGFSNSMSQPYTKSQLSEKVRRLRKKFRVISTRLAKGLDPAQLSAHDRALYDLSKRLWHPDYSATSPFNGARNVGLMMGQGGEEDNSGGGEVKRSGPVGIKVDFSPSLPGIVSGFDQESDVKLEFGDDGNVNGSGADKTVVVFEEFRDEDSKDGVKLSEVNVEFEGKEEVENGTFREGVSPVKVGVEDVSWDSGVEEVVAKAVIDVFNECFSDLRKRLAARRGCESGAECLKVHWQQQRVSELDALESRLRLVLDHSIRNR